MNVSSSLALSVYAVPFVAGAFENAELRKHRCGDERCGKSTAMHCTILNAIVLTPLFDLTYVRPGPHSNHTSLRGRLLRFGVLACQMDTSFNSTSPALPVNFCIPGSALG